MYSTIVGMTNTCRVKCDAEVQKTHQQRDEDEPNQRNLFEKKQRKNKIKNSQQKGKTFEHIMEMRCDAVRCKER